MPRPTPAALAFARSTLSVRRVAPASPLPQKSPFASLLHNATRNQPRPPTGLLKPASSRPLDSKACGGSRHTTDSLASVARPIARDQLPAGDALNLTTARDADGTGHVRLFDRGANAEKTRPWVDEETPAPVDPPRDRLGAGLHADAAGEHGRLMRPQRVPMMVAAGLAMATIRQCAWCWRVVDRSGAYSLQPGRKIRSATHGICPTCKEAMRADIDRTTPALLAA